MRLTTTSKINTQYTDSRNTIDVAVTSLEAALFLRNGQESNHILNPLQTKYRVTIQVTGIGRSALRISGQSQDVADCVLAWEELRKVGPEA